MNALRSHFPSRGTRRNPECLRVPPFQFAPRLAKPTRAKRFEDTRAGNVALAVMLGAAAIVCAVRFGYVMLTGGAW